MQSEPEQTTPNISSLQGFLRPPERSVADRKALKQHLPELLLLEKIIRKNRDRIQVRVEDHVEWLQHMLPLYSLTLGNQNKLDAPTILLTAGIHGIERIGTQVLLAWLSCFLERLRWDNNLQKATETLQIVLVPIVNPAGMYANRRSNGRHVDLNRNSPVVADGRVPLLGGGHRISTKIPWYRGRQNLPMEKENLALEKLIQRQLYTRPFALVLDLHSGFGVHDRVWFPYAYRHKPIASIADYLALKLLWERVYSNHNYIFEPQSLHYLSHGDLWDHFHIQSKAHENCNFMPLTLEMGSWAWVKKRPRQIFNMAGLFNPQKSHRLSRVLRRHLTLIDFLVSATANQQNWIPKGKQNSILKQAAKGMWYQ